MLAEKNRRRHVRAPSVFQGIALGEKHAHCVVDGLSVGGARLVGVSAPVGTRLRLTIDLYGKPLLLHANVVRKELDAIGVRFDPLHPKMEERIRRAVVCALEAYPVEPVVLIVDESPATQLELAKDLRSLSYEVRTASSALDAIWVLDDPTCCVQAAIVDAKWIGDIRRDFPNVRSVVLEKPWERKALEVMLG